MVISQRKALEGPAKVLWYNNTTVRYYIYWILGQDIVVFLAYVEYQVT